MAVPVLNIEAREATGKSNARKARREGRVPAVIYSRGQDTKKVYVRENEAERVLSHYGISSRVSLDFEGEKSFAIIKEIQRDPVKNTLMHVDLQNLNENEKIRLVVPIHLLNRELVETSTEIVQMQLDEVEIQTYPKYLPERVEIDASLLKKKDNINIGDLNIANDENIEILQSRDSIIATLVNATRGTVTEGEGGDEEE